MALANLHIEGLTPEAVAALERYERWCSAHPERSGCITLMSSDEQDSMEWWAEEFCPDALFLLHDDSNCAAVYTSGPPRDTVLILMHDDERLTPYFGSMETLVDVLVTDVLGVRDFGMLTHAEPSLGDAPAERLDALFSAMLVSDDPALWRYGPRVLAENAIHGLGPQLEEVLDDRELEEDSSSLDGRILEILQSAAQP
ncbi:MAG: hypothetical protein ACK5LS_02795 [Propioniciclava sp.]